ATPSSAVRPVTALVAVEGDSIDVIPVFYGQINQVLVRIEFKSIFMNVMMLAGAGDAWQGCMFGFELNAINILSMPNNDPPQPLRAGSDCSIGNTSWTAAFLAELTAYAGC